MRAMEGRKVVQQVLAVGETWEASKLNEHSNQYVDDLCQQLYDLWEHISMSGHIPPGAKTQVWHDLIQNGYLCILEGFSRVQGCSTEGRSLMSMDLAAYTVGMASRTVVEALQDSEGALPPTNVQVSRGRAYVDAFVKASYLPRDDLMEWIEQHYTEYPLKSCLSLVRSVATGRDVQELSETVKTMYRNCPAPDEKTATDAGEATDDTTK